MLVISRKLDQSIIIDGSIEILVIGLGKEGVRLGIKAPKEVQIHRREVFDAIAEVNRAASAPAASGDPAFQGAAALLRASLPKARTVKNE